MFFKREFTPRAFRVPKNACVGLGLTFLLFSSCVDPTRHPRAKKRRGTLVWILQYMTTFGAFSILAIAVTSARARHKSSLFFIVTTDPFLCKYSPMLRVVRLLLPLPVLQRVVCPQLPYRLIENRDWIARHVRFVKKLVRV